MEDLSKIDIQGLGKLDELVGINIDDSRAVGRVWLKSDSFLVVVPPANFQSYSVQQGKSVYLQLVTSHGVKTFEGMVGEVRAVPAIVISGLKPTASTQRRRYPRVNVRLTVHIWPNDEPWEIDSAVICKSLNISATGIRVSLNRHLDVRVGDTVSINVSLPEDRSLQTPAVVRRIRIHELDATQELGLEYLNLPPEDREMLVKYVMRRQFERG